MSDKNLKKMKKLWKKKSKITTKRRENCLEFATKKYGINEKVYRFDTRDYREIFRNGFKSWPGGSTPNSDYYNLSKFINS